VLTTYIYVYISYHWDAAPNRYICLTAAGVNWELTCHDYYVGMSANPEHGVLVKVRVPQSCIHTDAMRDLGPTLTNRLLQYLIYGM
jgi:hypothetical protein